MLCEEVSMRATGRLVGCGPNTVDRLLVNVGRVARQFHHDNVLRISAERVECDV